MVDAIVGVDFGAAIGEDGFDFLHESGATGTEGGLSVAGCLHGLLGEKGVEVYPFYAKLGDVGFVWYQHLAGDGELAKELVQGRGGDQVLA